GSWPWTARKWPGWSARASRSTRSSPRWNRSSGRPRWGPEMAETTSDPFRVVYPERLREQLRRSGSEAVRLGVGARDAEALRAITGKRDREPLAWGDPQFRQRHFGLVIYRGLHSVFRVSYAVDESRRIVYVRPWEILPDRTLGEC